MSIEEQEHKPHAPIFRYRTSNEIHDAKRRYCARLADEADQLFAKLCDGYGLKLEDAIISPIAALERVRAEDDDALLAALAQAEAP